MLISKYITINMRSYIWNCGRILAGNATVISKSLHADKYKCNHAGWLWAFKPLLLFITNEESKVDIRRKWELENTPKICNKKSN